MQDYSLTLDKFLDHAAKWFGDRQVVSVVAGQAPGRIGYAELRQRSNRLSGALQKLGLAFGDRVATLGWNSEHHLELYYATMAAGWVCHTLNPRYTPERLVAIINEADDRVLAVAASLTPLLADLLPHCPCIRHVIVMDGGPVDGTVDVGPARQLWRQDDLIDALGAEFRWGDFDENSPAGLCYTSGTTGVPKGVLYTHRSNYLHTVHASQANAFGLTQDDVVLAAVPMFHANGWGLPYDAPVAGAKLVLPGQQLDGASLARLMRDEAVTVAVGVHTVWMNVIDHLDAAGGTLPALRRVVIGGSDCAAALVRSMQERLHAQVQRSWGMTELSPLGTTSMPGDMQADPGASGRPSLGVDLKLVDADGKTLPDQRGPVGHLRVKGASVLDRYYLSDASELDAEGYLDTGDMASIDAHGDVTIRGRSKDLIKSGGEWINPAVIEEIIGQQPGVGLVAVVGRHDAKWGERPVLVVQPDSGCKLDPAALLTSLEGKVLRWWIPDAVEIVSAMPLAATGKIDKQALRTQCAHADVADGPPHA